MSDHLARPGTASPWSDPPPADHSVKIPHLVFGLLFLGVAGIWALVMGNVVTEDRLPVIAPAVLIAAGVIGLAASLASTRNRARVRAEQARARDETFGDESVTEHDDHTEEIR